MVAATVSRVVPQLALNSVLNPDLNPASMRAKMAAVTCVLNNAQKPVVLRTEVKTASVVHRAKKAAALKAVRKVASNHAVTAVLAAAALATSLHAAPSPWAQAASSPTPLAVTVPPSATLVPKC